MPQTKQPIVYLRTDGTVINAFNIFLQNFLLLSNFLAEGEILDIWMRLRHSQGTVK